MTPKSHLKEANKTKMFYYIDELLAKLVGVLQHDIQIRSEGMKLSFQNHFRNCFE